MAYRVGAACRCETGRRRKNNEDNLFFDGHILPAQNSGTRETLSGEYPLRGGFLCGVFDGMGGESFGEEASFWAAETVRSGKVRPAGPFRPPEKYLGELIQRMNGAVCARAAELDSGRMGSTAVLLYLNAREAWVCNVGDSRAFLLRDGELRQLSVDHTDAGLLAAQGVRGRKPALTQHLGIRPEEMVLEPHFFREKLRPGDWYLLCSDGLTDMVSEEEIRSAAETAPDAGQCVRKLTEAALENGGRDNVTVIAVRIIPDP